MTQANECLTSVACMCQVLSTSTSWLIDGQPELQACSDRTKAQAYAFWKRVSVQRKQYIDENRRTLGQAFYEQHNVNH